MPSNDSFPDRHGRLAYNEAVFVIVTRTLLEMPGFAKAVKEWWTALGEGGARLEAYKPFEGWGVNLAAFIRAANEKAEDGE